MYTLGGNLGLHTIVLWTAYSFISHYRYLFYLDIHFVFLLSTAGILGLKIVCVCFFKYYPVIYCTLRTAYNFEVDLRYCGELSDIVKVLMDRKEH